MPKNSMNKCQNKCWNIFGRPFKYLSKFCTSKYLLSRLYCLPDTSMPLTLFWLWLRVAGGERSVNIYNLLELTYFGSHRDMSSMFRNYI